jgi:hypothetical protein
MDLVGIRKGSWNMSKKHESRWLCEDRSESPLTGSLPMGFVMCPVLGIASHDLRTVHAIYQWAYQQAVVQTQIRAGHRLLSLGDPVLN